MVISVRRRNGSLQRRYGSIPSGNLYGRRRTLLWRSVPCRRDCNVLQYGRAWKIWHHTGRCRRGKDLGWLWGSWQEICGSARRRRQVLDIYRYGRNRLDVNCNGWIWRRLDRRIWRRSKRTVRVCYKYAYISEEMAGRRHRRDLSGRTGRSGSWLPEHPWPQYRIFPEGNVVYEQI